MSEIGKSIKMGGLPKPLSLEEKKYLLAVRRGDLTTVQRMIHRAYEYKSIDIDCSHSSGRGAINLAIDSENLEMVELLLVMGVQPKDALLHAIDAEFVEAVELLLEYEEIVYSGDKYSWEKVDWNTSVYTPDITPLILAAHKNNFEILKILLDRGAALPTPHRTGCDCLECMYDSETDSLRHSISRVNVYRALASSSLIALSYDDPILRAFKLSWELRGLAYKEKECKSEYTEIRHQCQQFAVDLLDQVRSSEELTVILTNSTNVQYTPTDTPDIRKLPTLELAVKYRQKQFIAHAHIQRLLSKIWYDGLPGFRSKSLISKCLHVVKIAVMFPLYCLIYIIAPDSNMGQKITKPVVKFLVHVTSYLLFLGILILVSQRAEVQLIEILGTDEMKKNLEAELRKQRGNPPTLLEWIAFIYVIGYIKEMLKEINEMSFEEYLKVSMWNVVQFVKSCIYVIVMGLRIYAYIKELSEISADPNTAFIPREKWHAFDPELIAEGLFALANILSALRLLHMFSANSHLGPLQISLGRMVIDIVKFFFIYSLVIFSFACGLNQLLWYYANLESQKCYSLPGGAADWENNGEACTKWRKYGNVFESIQTLFWTAFGEAGVENFDLTGISSFTRFWGLLIFGIYCIINVTVLLNLLIAMMSNSYSTIEEQSDKEWKFARTKLWLKCLEDMPVLPSPFNLLPTRSSFADCCSAFSPYNSEDDQQPVTQKEIIDERNKNTHETRYSQVMRALVWRYICSKNRKSEERPVTEDDIEEIKSDISSLKYQIWETFGKNSVESFYEDKHHKSLSKKLRIWERQLMKDFHVGLISKVEEPEDEDTDEVIVPLKGSESKKSPLTKFRNAAKQVAPHALSDRWKVTIDEVCKASQIGWCRTAESLKKSKQLQRAMSEARNFGGSNSTVRLPMKKKTLSTPTLQTSRLSLLHIFENNDGNEGKIKMRSCENIK